jgi:hypothetical protein
MLSLDHVLFI